MLIYKKQEVWTSFLQNAWAVEVMHGRGRCCVIFMLKLARYQSLLSGVMKWISAWTVWHASNGSTHSLLAVFRNRSHYLHGPWLQRYCPQSPCDIEEVCQPNNFPGLVQLGANHIHTWHLEIKHFFLPPQSALSRKWLAALHEALPQEDSGGPLYPHSG